MIATSQRVLVVDDDTLIANSIELALRQEGYEVFVAATGQDALTITELNEPDLIVLDIGLPDISGIEVCRRLRQYSTAPILYLTAHQAEVEKVVALDAGGDDYVTKPASIAELLARVRANLGAYTPEPLRVVMRSTAAVISPWTPRPTSSP